MKNIILSSIFICISFLLKAQCSSDPDLATVYNQNNGQRGAMIDITSSSDCLEITCFDASLYAGTTANYEIYYKAGSFIGSENNAAAWTLAGSATGITSAGNDLPTPLPIPINISIPSGQTYAFYITNDFGGGTSYTDCNSATEPLASNASLSITGGVGKSYPFGLTFAYRCFNGTVHYTDCNPPCATQSAFVR